MKISTYFKLGFPLACLCFSLQVAGQSGSLAYTSADFVRLQSAAPVNNQVQTVPLSTALPEIEARYKVTFLYRSYDIKGKRVPANLVEQGGLKAALQSISEATGLVALQTGASSYTLSLNKNEAKQADALGALLQPSISSPGATTVASAADPIKIKVKVLDETGQPLPGAAVVNKATKAGAATTLDGEAQVDAEPGAVLVVSYIGYITQEVVVGQSALGAGDVIRVDMKPDVQAQNEVVVVGYGTQTKRSVSSSIGSVNAREISATPVADAGQALQGRVAGVQVIQNSGAPGGTGGTSIRIRGVSSVTGSNNPLIVLDGFPLPDQTSDNVLNSIPPADIESIDILKDAAAASIYGVRGSNGVVMITTKRGKTGKAKVSVDFYRGLQSPWNKLNLLDAHDYAVLNSEARIASGLPPIDKLANPDAVREQYGSGTDWQDEIFRSAAMTNASVTVSGGTDAARYSVSGGYFQQDGIIRGTDFDRFSLRFAGDYQVSPKLKVGNSLITSRTVEHPKNTFGPFTSLPILAITAPPTVLARNPDGSYAGGNAEVDGFNENNPVYEIEVVGQTSNTRYRAIGSVFADYEVLPGLTLRANLGLDFLMGNVRTWNPAVPSTGGRPTPITSYSENTSFNPSYLAEYTANYKKKIADHSFSLLGGYTVQESNFNGLGVTRGNGAYNRQDLVSIGAAFPTTLDQAPSFGFYGTNRLLSFVSRFGYDYKGKYVLSASLRRDGSSNFGPGNKYAVFPAVSVAWNATDEPFMANVPYLSNLKIRGSYGQTGNQNVGAFSYIQTINTGIQYPFGDNSLVGTASQGAAPTSIRNPNLRWERNIQSNVGIDFGFIGNRINLTVDLYRRQSNDLIFSVAPTILSGVFESTPFNTGVLVNRGIDLTLNTVNTDAKSKVQWNTTFIFSKFTNEVTDLGLSAPIQNNFARISGGNLRVAQGNPVNYFFGYVADGIFQNQDEINNHAVQTPGTSGQNGTAPGDIRFKDLNGDKIINDQDRTNIGNSIPNFTYGFTNTATYKGIELTVFLQGSTGNKVLNFTRWYTEGGVSNGNFSQAALGRWTGPGTSNDMPRMTQADPNQNNRVSTRFVEDASYLRLKNVRLSYALPAKWVGATTASGIKIYASVQNAITWTKYTGFDPEVGGGVDYGFYPQARTYLGGVTFDF